MSSRMHLKRAVELMPAWLSMPLSRVPFSARFGMGYVRSASAIREAERMTQDVLESRLIDRLRALLDFAFERVEFYRSFYRERGFQPKELQSLADWVRVPIVTKADMQAVPLRARTARNAAGMKVNTGGTSGQPLEFLIDTKAFAREWAHMHYLWQARGYRPQHLKVTFRGKHFRATEALRYNAVHNEYVVNANVDMSAVVEAVLALPRTTVVRWLHGYPSLLAEFAHSLAEFGDGRSTVFRSRLFGVLLGSEYPAPGYRSVIEGTLSTNVVTWYGHSEMAMLARETARDVYESLSTYGYAEAVPNEEGGDSRLVCTALHNRVHPFIRYDTGDLVKPVSQHGGSLAFRVTEGRVGDFICDRNGRRHSLTAIVFGRHHAAFELVRHLQVREDAPGRVTLVITPRRTTADPIVLRQGFDLDDLDIEWGIELVDAPVRTQAGKIQLKLA